jgi:hypothetical protein
LHDEKEFSPRNATDDGRQIDFNDEHLASARASIRVSLDPHSNVNDESDSHDEKQSQPRISTEAGRQIDRNNRQFENAVD